MGKAKADTAVNDPLILSEQVEKTAHKYQPPQEWYDHPEDED
jgi:hypothetical protein